MSTTSLFHLSPIDTQQIVSGQFKLKVSIEPKQNFRLAISHTKPNKKKSHDEYFENVDEMVNSKTINVVKRIQLAKILMNCQPAHCKYLVPESSESSDIQLKDLKNAIREKLDEKTEKDWNKNTNGRPKDLKKKKKTIKK